MLEVINKTMEVADFLVMVIPRVGVLIKKNGAAVREINVRKTKPLNLIGRKE